MISGFRSGIVLLVSFMTMAGNGPGRLRADPVLDEIVDFTGQVLFIDTKVPALVIGAVRNGEVSVRGFGERAGPGTPPPDGDTVLRVGSVTKAFTGDLLAHMTAAGTVRLADPLIKVVPDFGAAADPNVGRIRLVDLATHAGGLPREVPHAPGSDNDPRCFIPISDSISWRSRCPRRRGGPIPTSSRR
jgi:D-alanyl-D-alanine-carboxypeptidase/D-alanyl-D-alanine-endopeptidase